MEPILKELKEKKVLTKQEQEQIAEALVNGTEEEIIAVLCAVAGRLHDGP